MKTIKQASEIFALIERGDFNHDLSTEIQRTLSFLMDNAPPKGKIKGVVAAKLEFVVTGNSVEINAAYDSKLPKLPRATSFYFVTKEGELSTEHPQQDRLNFDGPREVKM